MIEKNKIVVITGASKGIGKEILKKFLSVNSKIYFTYRKKNQFLNHILKNKNQNKNLIPIKCDMSNIKNLTQIMLIIF